MIKGMHIYPSHTTSTYKTEMELHSGSKDLTVPSIMLMRFLHGTLLSRGKPLGRPLDSVFVGDISQHDVPIIDQRGIGALEDHDTAFGVLGRLKEEGDILPTSSLPTFISDSALWEEKHGRNDLPTYTFGIGDVKEGRNHMKSIPFEDRKSVV